MRLRLAPSLMPLRVTSLARASLVAACLLATPLATPLAAQKPATTKPTRAAPAKRATSKPATSKPASKAATKPATKPATTKPARAKPVAAKPVAPAPVAVPARDSVSPDAQRAAGSVTVREGPGGRPLATLAPNTVVTPLLREGGWVRVRLEAWVPETDLLPADTSVATQLAAADLRADPDGTRGRTVRWEVELLAFQVADALRREFAADEPYLLVRGPGDENAMLYLALPPSLVASARGLPPLTRLLVTARVRNGRSAPAGLPLLDVLTLTPLRGG